MPAVGVLWDPRSRAPFSHSEPWIEDQKGEISGFRLPDGREASAGDVEQDARNWARACGRDARSCFTQNHTHDCTDTRVKYGAQRRTLPALQSLVKARRRRRRPVDLYQHSIVIERIRLLRLLAHRPNAGNVFAFDAHYRLANSYCQQITARPRTVPRAIGSACPRSDARDGEDYACWMATLFTPLRCPSRGGCADPLQCSAVLVETTIPSKESSGATEPARRGRSMCSFARGTSAKQRSKGLRAEAA